MPYLYVATAVSLLIVGLIMGTPIPVVLTALQLVLFFKAMQRFEQEGTELHTIDAA